MQEAPRGRLGICTAAKTWAGRRAQNAGWESNCEREKGVGGGEGRIGGRWHIILSHPAQKAAATAEWSGFDLSWLLGRQAEPEGSGLTTRIDASFGTRRLVVSAFSFHSPALDRSGGT